MLIVSKFKDYYDGAAQSKGIDKTIVYRRVNENLIVSELYATYNDSNGIYFPSYEVRYPTNKDYLLSFDTCVIGFCGKIYPLMIIVWKSNAAFGSSTRKEFVYDIKIIKEYYLKHCSKWLTNFENYSKLLNSSKVLDLFVLHKTPIFILTNTNLNYWNKPVNKPENLELNPKLKDYEFFKVMDTFTAFQEIEMYISGVLGVDSQKTIEVSDRSKIEGHGFDFRWSFRKEKKK